MTWSTSRVDKPDGAVPFTISSFSFKNPSLPLLPASIWYLSPIVTQQRESVSAWDCPLRGPPRLNDMNNDPFRNIRVKKSWCLTSLDWPKCTIIPSSAFGSILNATSVLNRIAESSNRLIVEWSFPTKSGSDMTISKKNIQWRILYFFEFYFFKPKLKIWNHSKILTPCRVPTPTPVKVPGGCKWYILQHLVVLKKLKWT